MSGLQFAADVIGSLAWPVVVLGVVFLLRIPLAGLIARIRAWKGFGNEVAFEKTEAETEVELAAAEAVGSPVHQVLLEDVGSGSDNLETDATEVSPGYDGPTASTGAAATNRAAEKEERIQEFREALGQRRTAVETLIRSAVGLGAFAQDRYPMERPTDWANHVMIAWTEDSDLPRVNIRTSSGDTVSTVR